MSEKKSDEIILSKFEQNVFEHMQAGFPILNITTVEEGRAEASLARICERAKMKVFPNLSMTRWDCVGGWDSPKDIAGKMQDPLVALQAMPGNKFSGHKLFVMRDLDDFWSAPDVTRILRTYYFQRTLVNQTASKRPMVVLTPGTREVPPKLRNCITTIDFQLPDAEDLLHIVTGIALSIYGESRPATVTPQLLDDVAHTLLGLTTSEAEDVLALCSVKHRGLVPEMMATIKDEKATIIKQSEILTYISEDKLPNPEDIGGYDNLKEFINRRKLAYSREARESQLDMPKGIILLGVPGTGKSFVAYALGGMLGLPVFEFNVGAVYGSLVGESEARMRSALKTIDAQHGCVMLVDEADKAFGGAADAVGDSGVTKRVMGNLLTWLAAKKDRTFVVMTLNRIDGLPPELLRPGRFDKVFFTDLPEADTRKEILKIHFRKRGIKPEDLKLNPADWKHIVDRTDRFVGAELEEIVREARYLAFEARQSGVPTFAEITAAATSIKPLSTLDEEGVEKIRKFCNGKATNVEKEQAVQADERRAVTFETN